MPINPANADAIYEVISFLETNNILNLYKSLEIAKDATVVSNDGCSIVSFDYGE